MNYDKFVNEIPNLMPEFDPEKFNFNADWILDPNSEPSWEDIVQLTRENNKTIFSSKRAAMHNFKAHGEVCSGPINWFIVYSINQSITSMDDDIRRYRVACFTPMCAVLHAHDEDNPFSDTSLRLEFEEPDKPISIAEKLADRSLDPNEWKWY